MVTSFDRELEQAVALLEGIPRVPRALDAVVDQCVALVWQHTSCHGRQVIVEIFLKDRSASFSRENEKSHLDKPSTLVKQAIRTQ